MRYFDTGVLLKLYLPEPRAADAVALVNAVAHAAPITLLHEMEMRSAMRQKVGRGEISTGDCQTLLAQLDGDLDAGVHKRSSVTWPDVFAKAEELSARHGEATLCRTLDTLHVALALELGADEFCTL